jgi:hypothetical protein
LDLPQTPAEDGRVIRVYIVATIVLIVAAVAFGLYERGVYTERARTETQILREYRDTTERMQNAGEGYMADDVVLERLRERAGQR